MLRHTSPKEAGFTIVEVTVVVIVVSILIAIGSVSYIAIQSNAKLQDVREDLNVASRIINDYKAKTSAYPTVSTNLTGQFAVGFKKRLYKEGISHNIVYCTTNTYNAFALLAINKEGKKVYATNTSTAQEYKGSVNWENGDRNAMCQSALPSSYPRGASGYQGGSWQAWANAQ